jgi:hypothetical protein
VSRACQLPPGRLMSLIQDCDTFWSSQFRTNLGVSLYKLKCPITGYHKENRFSMRPQNSRMTCLMGNPLSAVNIMPVRISAGVSWRIVGDIPSSHNNCRMFCNLRGRNLVLMHFFNSSAFFSLVIHFFLLLMIKA